MTDSIVFGHDFKLFVMAYYGNSDEHLWKEGIRNFLKIVDTAMNK